jgi:hypothetical protein
VWIDGFNSPTTNGVNNHCFTGNFYDYGQTAFHIQRKEVVAADNLTVCGVTITGGIAQYAVRGVYIAGATQVNVSGLQTICNSYRLASSDVAKATAFHIDVYGTGHNQVNGVQITGCTLGREWRWLDASSGNYTPTYGLWIDGADANDLIISGNHFWGSSAGINLTNGAPVAGMRWVFSANFVGTGTLPFTSADVIPSVASAASITIPPNEVVKVTGTTTVNTLNGLWIGREVKIITPSALTFTGGNIAVPKTTVAGEMVTAIYDGSAVYLK